MKNSYFIPAALILVGLLYLPALSGGFLLDDNVNLLTNKMVQLGFGDADFLTRALNSGIASDLGRPVSMLSFAFEHAVVGTFDPQVGKSINLAIHLANMLLFVLLIRAFAMVMFHNDFIERSELDLLIRWAPLVAFFWAVLPSNVGAVMYVIQRMNLLATFFSLAGICVYFRMRYGLPGKVRQGLLLGASCVLIFLGILSKENAVLAFLFIIGFEILVWYRTRIEKLQRYALLWVIILIAALIVVVPWVSETVLDGGYRGRVFTWSQRLLLQPLAICWYTVGGIFPFAALPRFFMDFLETSQYLSMPPLVYLALAGVLAILGWMLSRFIKDASLPIYFSLGWFAIFHLVESTFWPLELAFPHRNYLPIMGLILGAAICVIRAARRWNRARSLVLMIWVYAFFLSSASALESIRWGSEYTLLATESEAVPVSPRAAFSLGVWYYRNDPTNLYCQEAKRQFSRAIEAQPDVVAGYYGEILVAEKCGEPITSDMLQKMENVLATQPQSAAPFLFLDSLVGYCRAASQFDCQAVMTLIDAAISNPNVSSHYLPEYHMVRAKLAYYQKDFDEALRSAQEVLEYRPESVQAHLMNLDVMYSSGNCEGLESALNFLSDERLLYLIERDIQPLDERYPDCALSPER